MAPKQAYVKTALRHLSGCGRASSSPSGLKFREEGLTGSLSERPQYGPPTRSRSSFRISLKLPFLAAAGRQGTPTPPEVADRERHNPPLPSTRPSCRSLQRAVWVGYDLYFGLQTPLFTQPITPQMAEKTILGHPKGGPKVVRGEARVPWVCTHLGTRFCTHLPTQAPT